MPAQEQSRADAGPPPLQIVGWLLLIGGVCAALYYWLGYDTSVDAPTIDLFGQHYGGGRVHNLGLMQDRQTGIIIGLAAAVAGVICVASTQRSSQDITRQITPDTGRTPESDLRPVVWHCALCSKRNEHAMDYCVGCHQKKCVA